jgi:hypothetical protein
MNLTTTGRSTSFPVRGGPHFLNIDGASFGGTAVRLDWQEEEGDEWSPLLDEDGAELAVTAAYNKVVTLGEGYISFFLTGGTGIDLKATVKRAY